jgi:uroporphyrinogen-III decarboxylase
MDRRHFLLTIAALPVACSRRASLSYKQRIDRAIEGAEVDRPPFTFWHHFGLKTAEAHAKATLDFHSAYRTDLVKVMSDFPYPKPAGKWYELKPVASPYPDQIRALELIRDALQGQKYFIETIFNPWTVAENLSSAAELLKLKDTKPKLLLDALDVITQSQINHAKLALSLGASGLLYAVANANSKGLSPEDYLKFSAPFDKRILEATAGAKLNFLHLHIEPPYLGLFRDFPATVFNYSQKVSGIPIADVRKQYASVIAGGIDEVNYRTLTVAEMKAQWEAASKAAGPKFILTPGCSVPNDSAPAELSRLPQVLGA